MAFLLFAGANYYADGGAADLKGAYASEEEARLAFVRIDNVKNPRRMDGHEYDWAHILDTESMSVTILRRGSYCGSVSDHLSNCFTVKPA